jgi:hypothetical protein
MAFLNSGLQTLRMQAGAAWTNYRHLLWPARHRYIRLPAIRTTISSRCHRSLDRSGVGNQVSN